MILTIRNKAFAALLAALATICVAGNAVAQDYDGAPDSEIRQTVARLAYVSGNVSFSRGDDPDEWQPADPNVPLTIGDRAWTSGGRLELQIHGGNIARLAPQTDLTALNLTEDTKQLSVSAGTASFQIRRLGEEEVFEVDTPNAAITFERPGEYRIDVGQNGDTRLQVRRGRALVASGGGQVPLRAGEAIAVDGFEPPRYDMISIAPEDGWDRWVVERDARFANVRSYQYVSPDIAGVEDLDQYGRWQSVPNYGWCWTPATVAVGWAPYRAGRWIWQDPWGWTWVAAEPWGWAPYHYGRWVVYSSHWYWVPVAPRVAVVTYSPALVAFVGGGPGFGVSVGVAATTDYIGWFPLAPRDPLIPWWGRPAVNVHVTNVTYVNRTYVTVVNQTTFVSSRVVTTAVVRDKTIVNTIERAPVVRGAIPIVPTRESIRVARVAARPAVAPPAAVTSRAVVTRMAPPPAPPRFDSKVALIKENRGRPVTTAEARQIVTREGRATAQPAQSVRPVAAESGRVTLAPKTEDSRAPKPEPVAPVRGRPLATKEQPVSAAPPEADARDRGRPQTQAPPAQQPPAEDRSQRETVDRRPAERPQAQAPPPQQPPAQDRSQRETADRRPAERPTARPAESSRPQPAPDRSTQDRSTQAHPTPDRSSQDRSQRESSDRRAADRPTPRPEAAPQRGQSSQPKAVVPREAEQPAERVAPDRQPNRQPPPSAAAPEKSQSQAPERGKGRPTPKPAPTKKDEKKSDG